MCAACVIAINDVQLLLLLLLSDNLKYSIQLCSLICRLQHCNLLRDLECFILAQLNEKMPIYYSNTTTKLSFRSHIVSKSAINLWKISNKFSHVFKLEMNLWKNGLLPNDGLESGAIWLFLGEFHVIMTNNYSSQSTINDNPTTGFRRRARHILFYIIQSILFTFSFVCIEVALLHGSDCVLFDKSKEI